MSFLTDETLFSGTLNDSDVIHLVDVSDTTQNAAGSSFKLTIGQLKAAIPTIYTGNGTLSSNRTVLLDSKYLSFQGGSVGIGTVPDTDSALHIKGVDSTFSNKSAKFTNSAGDIIFEVANSKVASAGRYGGGNVYTGFAGVKSKILAVNLTANPVCDIEIFCDDSTSDSHFGFRSSYLFWVHSDGLVYKYNAINLTHDFFRSLIVKSHPLSGSGEATGNFESISTQGIQFGVKGSATGASTKNIGGYFTASGATDNFALETNGKIKSVALPTYANNADALAGGLVADDEYKTATGERRIVV